MDRKKPTLTSPGKVGFLVALLMVVMALGVSYLITGTFGVTWHWIHTPGLSPATWTFNLGAFLEEMAPLLVLTSLLAFGAYVLIAGAVRRYKAYVDSGAEYKHLLKSIKGIDDLEDGDLLDRLKPHPELREFLMGVKHRVAAHERQHGERDRRTPPSPGESRTSLAAECAMLTRAVVGGRDAFPGEIALTMPELKQLERALRDFMARPEAESVAEPVARPVVDTAARHELESLRATLRSAVTAMRRDVEACAQGARELEASLGALSTGLQSGAGAAAAPANVDGVRKRIDATAEALTTLGEETKRIAIAAAMQASGGPEADAIKVAEELRILATRFNAVAQHWKQTAPELKTIIAASGAGSARASAGDSAAVAATAVTRARLWSERMVAVNEHVRALERAIKTTGDEPAETTYASPAPSPVDVEEVLAAPAQANEPPAADPAEDFISNSAAEVFGSASDADNDTDVSFIDIPGFEKERRFFAEDAPADRGRAPDDRFVVDNTQERRWDLADAPAEEETAAAAPATPAPQAGPDSDGFLTGPRPVVSPRTIERPEPAMERRSTSRAEVELSAATATIDPDADAIDLYELGAIDCVQTV